MQSRITMSDREALDKLIQAFATEHHALLQSMVGSSDERAMQTAASTYTSFHRLKGFLDNITER